MAGLNRTPPTEVREKLRREVNFGCPVEGCGEPYLSWHHFDPPWRENEHHDPDGMIALCLTHAGQADDGRWTREQLTKMKHEPYLKGDNIQSKYDYLRKNTVCVIGNVGYKVKDMLQVRGERVIGFNVDADGYYRLNLLIRDAAGSPILQMEDNFWTARTVDLYDISCSARGKHLEITSKDMTTNFRMQFNDYPPSTFRAYLKNTVGASEDSIGWFMSEIVATNSIPVWTIEGTLRHGNAKIDIRKNGVEILPNHIFIGSGFMVNCGVALSIN